MDRKQRFSPWLSAALGAIVAISSLGLRAQVGGLDLLPLSEAFRLEVSRPRAELVRVRWTIADGYYLYRHRIRLEATPAKVRDGFTLPAGIAKQDPFFGETEIYRDFVAFDLPLQPSASGLARISLRVVSQGCADIGICFPPEARTVDLAVGERAILEAGDPFASLGAEQPANLDLPVSKKPPGPPATGRSP